jgi:hypothetical protein
VNADFFSAKDAHALALGTACDKLFGPEWLEWEMRTIRDELKFHGFKTTEMSSQKIAAYKTSKVTIGPWAEMGIFEKVGMIFNNRMPNMEIHQPLSVAECAVTVDSLRMCRIVTFTEQVKKYIAACAASAEFLYLPDPLTFSMPYLCPPMYYCREHGGMEIDDLVDGQCDLCTGRYEDGELIDAPIPGLERRGVDIQRFSSYDYAPIATKYEALASLLDVNAYRLRKKAQLDRQLSEIASYG